MKELSKLDLTKKKYIIFDLDGTLIDSIGIWNMTDQKIINLNGGPLLNLEDIQVLRDNFLHNNVGSDIYLAFCEYLRNKYHLKISSAQELLEMRWDISGQILEKQIDFKPGVVDLILKLKSLGFIVILATMTTQVQLDIYSKKNKKMLEQMNILEVFDLITRKEDVKNKKPHPEIYNYIKDYFGATPQECLIFEDSYTGVLAASSAQIEVVNVGDYYSMIDREKINELIDFYIDSYQEFIDYVDLVYSNSRR